jgi:hypothetical protein
MLSIFNNLFDFNQLNCSNTSIAFIGLGMSLFSYSYYHLIKSVYQDSNNSELIKKLKNNCLDSQSLLNKHLFRFYISTTVFRFSLFKKKIYVKFTSFIMYYNISI